jgi:hypothetical protein
MEDIKMSSRSTTSSTDRRQGGDSPEEEAILARFLTRVSCGSHKAVRALSHGSFLVL